jgi:uncharacterized integral membrane protein (TIGR00698 family)
LRITINQVTALGWSTVLLVVVSVVLTVLVGIALARALGLGNAFGTLTGGAVAICGASAALAIASILPKHRHAERDASFTVIGVTALSTIAMIVYPLVVSMLGLDRHDAGAFLGATIHDVAQVVGAGYMISPEAGVTATFVKLLRVALLVPVVMTLTLVFHGRGRAGARTPLLPWFLVMFVLLAAANSAGWVPPQAGDSLASLSRWCLVAAIAALGVMTSFGELAALGWQPVILLVSETLFLGILIMGGLLWLGI